MLLSCLKQHTFLDGKSNDDKMLPACISLYIILMMKSTMVCWGYCCHIPCNVEWKKSHILQISLYKLCQKFSNQTFE